MLELADKQDLGSCVARRTGSTPVRRIVSAITSPMALAHGARKRHSKHAKGHVLHSAHCGCK